MFGSDFDCEASRRDHHIPSGHELHCQFLLKAEPRLEVIFTQSLTSSVAYIAIKD